MMMILRIVIIIIFIIIIFIIIIFIIIIIIICDVLVFPILVQGDRVTFFLKKKKKINRFRADDKNLFY